MSVCNIRDRPYPYSEDVNLKQIERQKGQNTDKSKKRGRNLLPFKDSEDIRKRLYLIGKSIPPITVKDFIQTIRYDDTLDESTGKYKTKMSFEYKILKRLFPAYYDKNAGQVMHKVFPFEYFHDIKQAKHLWTEAFVKLILDERTENDYRFLRERYENVRREYRVTSKQSLLEGARNKKIRERNESIEKHYAELSACEAAINSRPAKELGLCLSFRGLLALLHSEHEYRKHIEDKKGMRDLGKKHKDKAEKGRRTRINSSTERIHQVIRNPNVIIEAPFLKDSEFLESLGFDLVDLLLQISQELIDQLHIDANNDSYLLRRATERYFAEFNSYFFEALHGAVKKRYPMNVSFIQSDKTLEKSKIVSRLNDYRKMLVELLRTWAISEIKGIDNKSLALERWLKKEHNDSNKQDIK